MSVERKLSLGEARGAVVELIQACNIGERIMELVAKGDLDSLKVAEYALLVSPVTSGLGSYLDGVDMSKESGFMMPGEVSETIGEGVGSAVIDAYKTDPHKKLIDEIAQKRASFLPYQHMVYPLESTLEKATKFSSGALLGIAIANAQAIRSGGGYQGRTREEFIAAIKRSTQLVFSAPILHLEWNPKLNEATFRYTMGKYENAPSVNDEHLVYDPVNDRAFLTRPLIDWIDDEAHDFFGGLLSDANHIPGSKLTQSDDKLTHRTLESFEALDARIGCPVSFDPKLVRRYYEHVVDMIEVHESWPVGLEDPIKLKARLEDELGMDTDPETGFSRHN